MEFYWFNIIAIDIEICALVSWLYLFIVGCLSSQPVSDDNEGGDGEIMERRKDSNAGTNIRKYETAYA